MNNQLPPLAVMIGLGSFMGSLASIFAPWISSNPQFLHWFPLAVTMLGFALGKPLATKTNKNIRQRVED